MSLTSPGRNLPMAQDTGCACCSPVSPATDAASIEGSAMNTQTFSVNGMTCGHCASAVTDEMKALPGVSNVDIQLVPEGASIVTVRSSEPLTDEQVSAALDEAGDYRLLRS